MLSSSASSISRSPLCTLSCFTVNLPFFHSFVAFFLLPLIFAHARCAKMKGVRILMGIRYIRGGLYSGCLTFEGTYIGRAFCVSIFLSRLIKSIIISMKYWFCWQKLSFFKQMSSLFCFKSYLDPSWYLFILWLSTYLYILGGLRGWTWCSYIILFSGGLIFGGAYIRKVICVSM